MSGVNNTDSVTEEVSTSSTDVYASPIALGFEALTSSDAVVYGPVNIDEFDGACIPTVVYDPPGCQEIDTNLSAISYNKDVRDFTAIRGRCGLYNLGNTCFMNSGLQCLMGTLPLVKFLLHYHDNVKNKDCSLLGQFQSLFAKMWSGQFAIVHPKAFKTVLGIYHSQFQDYRQHDCQEFLALLLDSLHEQLNFKSHSTNRNQEAGPSTSKQPITFEHNINNKSCSQNYNTTESENPDDKSRNAASSHSSALTYDNMKDSKSNLCTSDRSQGQGSNEKTEEKNCRAAQSLMHVPFTVNSEDSNHSNVSEHSSDSECSVMKNLKLRSSPTVTQSSHSTLSSKIVNDCGPKDCCVSSSNDDNIDTDISTPSSVDVGQSTETGTVRFKRVRSLQDFRQKCEATSLSKASSDIDLVIKDHVDNDIDDHVGDCLDDLVGAKVKDESALKESAYSEINSEPIILNNAVSTTSVPSLEDLYSKETKTLNTNVLATQFIDETVTTDSDKFAKRDNTNEQQAEMMEEEDVLQNVMEVTTKNDIYDSMKIKDVNIRAEKKGKSPKGACGSGSLMNIEKEDCFALNSVKRMKFEGTEKNLQMQEICKIQKEALLCEALHVNKTANNDSMLRKEASPQLESDVDSDMLEGHEHEAEMEVSDEEEGDETLARDFVKDGAIYTASEIIAAEDAWQKYLSKNDSVVVDTFQGQFKSTVVCAECNQVSMTFEPFMYLSVPVPRAMERQLCVTFISEHCEPVQYLLVMYKQDKIVKVKRELCNLIGRAIDDIIIAEVLDWHISRILEDNTMLRYINDSSRELYAFEMNQVSVEGDNILGDGGVSLELGCTPASSQDSMTVQADGYSDMGDSFPRTSQSNISIGVESINAADGGPGSYFDHIPRDRNQSDYVSSDFVSNSQGTNLDMIGTGMWEWGDGNCDNKRRGSLETQPDGNWLSADSTTVDTTDYDMAVNIANAIKSQSLEVNNRVDCETGGVHSGIGGNTNQGNGNLGVNTEISGNYGTSGNLGPSGDLETSGSHGNTDSAGNGGSNEWKSCAICLEELPETELMIHTVCGGTFCSTCLEMSVQHCSEASYCCPVCSTPAAVTEDFVPLTNAANHKPKTRIIAIPIAYRSETDNTLTRDSPFLFAHPSMLNLPSNLTGPHIMSCITRLQPGLPQFRVLLTDGTGLRCSRCLFMEHCTGCEIAYDGEAILRPGDHLTVSVHAIPEAQTAQCQRTLRHKSMDKLSSNEPLTLLDCFSAFTQSEELDEHNPWFCPHCKENQRALKTMTVWQYPDTLIIQLKRFVFHELSSTKVDNKVIFPLDNLDLNEFISGPSTKNLVYNLYSLVCHFGGSNSGHYTSYAKHPVDGKWYYYNDETVTESVPSEDEFSSTYVLFYQRKGTDKALQIPDDLDLSVEPSSPPDQMISSSLPSLHFTPPEGEVTLANHGPETSKSRPGEITLNNQIPEEESTATDEPSTSNHMVGSSTGTFDLSSGAANNSKASSGDYARIIEDAQPSTSTGYYRDSTRNKPVNPMTRANRCSTSSDVSNSAACQSVTTSTDTEEDLGADSSQGKAEVVEADSTGNGFDFYM